MKDLIYRVVPAILTDNPESLTHMLCQAELFTDWVQIDIMDGIFVPSRSISARDIVAAETDLSWEAHLMVQDPKKCIEDFYAVGAKRIIVHYEAVKEEAQDVIKHIISFGMTAGIALNPETPTSVLDDKLLSNLDSVLVMAVQPGYYGAKFIPEVLDKITSFRKLYPDMNVGIDGGVKAANIAEIARSGANEICVGSAIFAQLDIASAYNELVKVAKQGWGL